MALVSRNTGSKKSGTVTLNYRTGGSTRCGKSNYLLDGRLEISNNRAENAIRPFTIGRKNWLFAVTPKGASASAAIYSLVESAKANGLEIYKYFNYILTLMPGMDWHNHPGLLEKLLPWSEKAKLYCADKKPN